MVRDVSASSIAGRSSLGRTAVLLALAAAIGGCGATRGSGPGGESAAADTPMTCPQTVLDTLSRVVAHVYHEGISSERTATARHFIGASRALREAVQAGNPAAATAAAQALVADGHLTNLRVVRAGTTLADVGGPALAPLRGMLTDAHGAPIASYLTSVWADSGFIAESDGIGQGLVALRVNGRSVGGSLKLPPASLPDAGTLTLKHVAYQYSSFPAKQYPSGSMRVYLLKPLRSTRAFCGASSEDTLVNTLAREASLIYEGEAGRRTQPQVRRVEGDEALLGAVARRDPAATKLAVEGLLNQHIVRLRVSVAGRVLADVGGPYVLAPVRGTLRVGGRALGTFVLSIQDDEGYLRLTRRLAGLYVLMYTNPAHPRLVKNSLGPEPGAVPQSGSFTYRGRSFRVFTIHADAFPSGALRISVLVPIPYR